MSNNSFKLNIYLNYKGNCREAFQFYEKHLGGKIISMVTFNEMPNPSDIPKDWGTSILHARIEIGNTVVTGADIPNAEPMRSAYLTITTESVDAADRIYALLSEGRQIFMKMEETFFAKRFAMLRDKFGTSWMIINEKQVEI